MRKLQLANAHRISGKLITVTYSLSFLFCFVALKEASVYRILLSLLFHLISVILKIERNEMWQKLRNVILLITIQFQAPKLLMSCAVRAMSYIINLD